MNVDVVGAGPAGLFLAVLLRRAGHEVVVHERDEAASTAGWGLTLMDGFVDEIEALDAPTGAAVRAAAVSWDSQVVEVSGRTPVRGPAAGHSIRRSTLVDVLTRRAQELGADIRYGDTVTDVCELPDADLVVAADGAASPLRARHAGELGTVLDRRRNVYTWLGTTREFEGFRFTFTRTPAGWVWVGAHTFDEGTSGFIVEMDPATRAGLGLDDASAQRTLEVLEGVFAPLLGAARLLPQSGSRGQVPWQHFTRVTNERWHTGRLVLVGDAAHTTHFSIGSGTRLAMQDAAALAQALGGPGGQGRDGAAAPADLEAALAAYGARRRAEIAQVSGEALNSVQWFEHVERYVRTDPRHFAMLYDRRRTWVHRKIPVGAYVALSDLSESVPALSAVAGRIVRRRTAAPQRRRTPA